MGKSLEEVMKKMQLEHEQRIQARNAEEQKVAMIAEQQRRQWAERNRMYEKSSLSNSAASSAAAGAGGGRIPDLGLTPFILQAWDLSTLEDWMLYRLTTDGNSVPVENAPPLEGPTVFAKNNQNGIHYYMTWIDSSVKFGMWDSLTGEWQFLEEDGEVLRDLVPASLQWIEGNDDYPSYFIYTDNNLYTGPGNEEIGSKTFRIDLSTPTSFELTELYEWEPPTEAGSFPISTFYQLPVAIGASPSQNLFQVQAYGTFNGGYPLASLSSIDGDTYERTDLGFITIDGLGIEAVKIAYILDRTDYNGDTYFNVVANDKINETLLYCIAKFDPTLENPNNLTSIYQYTWGDSPYISLTTI